MPAEAQKGPISTVASNGDVADTGRPPSTIKPRPTAEPPLSLGGGKLEVATSGRIRDSGVARGKSRSPVPFDRFGSLIPLFAASVGDWFVLISLRVASG